MEEPSLADTVSDSQREWSSPYTLAIFLAAIVWGMAFMKLGDPDLVAGTARTVWTVLPFPFLALGLWALFARDRRLDELNRVIERDAASFAMKLTSVWVFGIVLLSVAGFNFEWEIAVMWPLLFNGFGYVRARRRLGLR
jgi:hypothetical protein